MNKKVKNIFSVRIFLTVFLMYISTGVIASFVQGGVVPILREQGLEIRSISWVYILYLPIGMVFLWAPLVDRFHIAKLGIRTSWMVLLQPVVIIALLLISWIGIHSDKWIILFILAFITMVMISTVNIALDAFSAEQISDQNKGFAGGTKVIGFTLGTLVGGGLLLRWYPTLGWFYTINIMAFSIFITWIFAFSLIHIDKNNKIKKKSDSLIKKKNLISLLKHKKQRDRLVKNTFFCCAASMIFAFHRLLMVDMGIPLSEIGRIYGTWVPIFNLTICFISMILGRYIKEKLLIGLFSLLMMINTFFIFIAFKMGNTNMVFICAILVSGFFYGVFIVINGLILKWASEGEQTATDYSFIFGFAQLIPVILSIYIPIFIDQVGWSVFQILSIVAFILATYSFMTLFRVKDQ